MRVHKDSKGFIRIMRSCVACVDPFFVQARVPRKAWNDPRTLPEPPQNRKPGRNMQVAPVPCCFVPKKASVVSPTAAVMYFHNVFRPKFAGT